MRRRHLWLLLVSAFFYGRSPAAQQPSDEAIQTVPVAPQGGAQASTGFANEPTLPVVYKMAMDEAGLHPENIEKWMKGSGRKFWFPLLRVDGRYVKNDNFSESPSFSIVQDPDRVIERAEPDFTTQDNNQYQIEFTGTWSLPELIFDRLGKKDIVLTQGRILVMRQALLNNLSDAYYQRRRLQVELQLSPPASPLAREVLQLRIEELTAELDVLTGGGFSHYGQGEGK